MILQIEYTEKPSQACYHKGVRRKALTMISIIAVSAAAASCTTSDLYYTSDALAATAITLDAAADIVEIAVDPWDIYHPPRRRVPPPPPPPPPPYRHYHYWL